MTWGFIGAAAIGGGVALATHDWGGNEEQSESKTTEFKYTQLPDYKETTAAREDMYKRLQEWGGQEGYGAIPMNWDDIWEQAQKKVKQYYWGGPLDTGLVGKVKADAARKGQTDQPAYIRALSAMGKSEADKLSEMAVQQATEQAQYAEKGRQTWMNEMNYIMGLKPSFQVGSSIVQGGSTTQENPWMDLAGNLGTAAYAGNWGSEIADLIGNIGYSGSTETGYWENLGKGAELSEDAGKATISI